MKFIVCHSMLGFCLLLAFPIIGTCAAQGGNAENGPKLVCDALVYNFGTVNQSAVVTNVFVIRNEGTTTFVAGMPRVTCSCTKVTLNKRMIGPGESAKLTAVFTAARRKGEQKKTIILPSFDSNETPLKFYMQGFVETPSLSQ